jgi:glycosyltransferase involved in cell wall biosynthesis
MNRPLFSIVIPTYNRARIVGSAIQSCLTQTVTDFEIIVVDDEKSTDDVGRALACFPDAAIRLISGFRGTAAAARNGGVNAARGKYVAFLDSDDEFLPNKLERCLAQLEGETNVAVYSQTFVDRGVDRMWVKPARGLREGEDIFEYLLLHKQWVHPSTIALEAENARKYPFREDLVFGDDTQFAVDLCGNGIKLRMIEEPLAIYRDLGDSTQLSQSPVIYSEESPSNKMFIEWVESQRPYMSEQTYNAYRAWFLARFVVKHSPVRALGYLWAAYRGRSLTATQCTSQLIQVFMPRAYRRLANLVAQRAGRQPPAVVAEMRSRREMLARA